jgi:hypothetical protein
MVSAMFRRLEPSREPVESERLASGSAGLVRSLVAEIAFL